MKDVFGFFIAMWRALIIDEVTLMKGVDPV